MSSLKLKHSGGNSVIIAAPSSNPASDRTLTVPSNADGTILTTTNPKAGNILQVVTSSASTGVSQGFSSDAFVDTGLSASITPSSSSNKILVTGYLSYYISIGHGSAEWNFAVCDGSDNILDGTTATAQGYRYNEMYVLGGKHPINFLHSPSTTSSFTYKIRMNAKSANQSGSVFAQINSSGNNISRIVLMEVAG